MQKVKLANFEDEKTFASRAAIKEVDLLKNAIKTLNSSIEEETAKTLSLIALGQTILTEKDKQIKPLLRLFSKRLTKMP